MASTGKFADIVRGKSARACDNCLKKRARYYCDADDAFLCQSCDSSVHSANPLARRHQRVRIGKDAGVVEPTPSWHQGFKRKARSPRGKKNGKQPRVDDLVDRNPVGLVPEICSQELNEDQILFSVPMLDHDDVAVNFHDFVPSENDILEFAEDVDRLLGEGFDDPCFRIGELGIFDFDQKRAQDENKLEALDGAANEDYQIQLETAAFSPTKDTHETKTFLNLDIEGVLSAWNCNKSPFLTSETGKMKSVDFWTDFFGADEGTREIGVVVPVHGAATDGGREARVSRYREKRRSRLFAKKIRYEVRKLNAEKRPRIKGRFVKRTNFESPGNFSVVRD